MTNTYAHLRSLFERCVEIPEGNRLEWIEQHVPDTTLRIELALMLAADAGESGFLQRDVVARIDEFEAAGGGEFDPKSLVGRRFGSFELVRLLGQGGQGTVFLAERVAEDFHQTVAIKLLRRGIHDVDEHRRFRREREILARFEHPGVARLIDGGVSGDGVPYLAMEYIDGLAIDAWCDSQNLDRSARLQLFSQLCGVVAAAHRALIVHRDLKPSNVMVTANGAIKVLDFGIARLLDDEDVTRTHIPMMTPGYGAPEQANGGTITLSTDVHALGVLLRVLLTHESPAGTKGQLASSGYTLLPAELRWIIGKATIAEAELRYRDAAELDDDIRRLLDSRPVHAHPPSRRYRAGKFVQRHRGGILLTLAFVIGILASFGIALWQAQVARAQAHQAEATRDFLLGVFEAAGEDLPKDARPTPDVLAQAAAKKLDGETQLQPTMRADFLATLGDITKNSNDYEGALVFYDKALRILDAENDQDSRQHLRIETMRVWALSFLGRADEGVKALQPRLAALRAVTDAETIDGLWAYADALENIGKPEEGLAIVADARALAAEVYPAESVDALRLSLAYSHSLTEVGRIREGEEVLANTLQRWRAAKIPEQQDYATALANLSSLKRRLGDMDGAILMMRQALALSQRIHEDPHHHNAIDMQYLGRMLGERGDFEEAQALLADATAMLQTLFGPSHPLTLGSVGSQAAIDIERQRYAQAATSLQHSVELCSEAKLDGETRCISNYQLLSTALLRLGRIDEADVANAHSLRLRSAIAGEDNPDYAIPLRGKGEILLARGDAKTALGVFDDVLAMYARAAIPENLEVATTHANRGRALLMLGQPEDALRALDSATSINERLAARNEGRRLRVLSLRAQALAALHRVNDSASAARTAVALGVVRGVLEPGEWETLQMLAR